MKNASEISKHGNDIGGTTTAARRRSVTQLRDERRAYYRLFPPPPNVRHRRREARRWLDVLTVVSTNPGCSERRPGDGWLTNEEKASIWERAYEQLRESDLELSRAVDRLNWEESHRNAGGTMQEWQARIARRWPARNRLRATIRDEERCSHPMTWTQISGLLQRRFLKQRVGRPNRTVRGELA